MLLKQTVNFVPDHADAWVLLGVCQERNPNWRRDAAESFQMALSIDPNNVDAMISLGDLYKREGLITPRADLLRGRAEDLAGEPAGEDAAGGAEEEVAKAIKRLSANEWLLDLRLSGAGRADPGGERFRRGEPDSVGPADGRRLDRIGDARLLGRRSRKCVEKSHAEPPSEVGSPSAASLRTRADRAARSCGAGGLGRAVVGGHCIAAIVRASTEVAITVFKTLVQRALDDDRQPPDDRR